LVTSFAVSSIAMKWYEISKRGVSGGYVLARSPGEISLSQIVSAVEGPIVAGDFGPVDGAAIACIGTNGPTDGRLLVVTNPGRQGIDYIDLGSIASGTYLVAIGVPSWRGSPTALIEIAVD